MNKTTSLLTFLTVLFFYSCSSTGGMNTTSGSTNQIFPSWYSTTGFQADSSNFYGFGLSIASDSTLAIERATGDAYKNLDLAIGDLIENIRTQQFKDGSSTTGETNFILILRNSNFQAVKNARYLDSRVTNKEGTFRAFVKISIPKSDFVKHLEDGFTGNATYWKAFSDNLSFSSTFE